MLQKAGELLVVSNEKDILKLCADSDLGEQGAQAIGFPPSEASHHRTFLSFNNGSVKNLWHLATGT